jgi:ABC-type nitrate/sulfonate/bicarbonate transport system permease component
MTSTAESAEPNTPASAVARLSAISTGHRSIFSRLIAAVDPLRLVGAVLFVLAWQALAGMLPAIILPPPAMVVLRLGSDFFDAPSLAYYGVTYPNFYGNLIYTAENVAIAVIVGAAVGIFVGLLSARFGLVRSITDPIMMTAGTVPILIAAPFLLIWFGVGRASAVSLVIFYVSVILYVFAQRAASNLNPIYEDFARTLGATRRQIITDLLIPGTVPEILGGLRIALAGAWGLEAIAELLGSQAGIGKVIEVLAGATDTEGIMAALLLLGLVAIVVDAFMGWVVARLAGWSASLSPGKN